MYYMRGRTGGVTLHLIATNVHANPIPKPKPYNSPTA